jgi:hypothetical protein
MTMKKTITIDIAGQIFKIDEDAYDRLKNYLDQVNASFAKEPGGEETISDIETRIAEIFGGGNESPVIVTKEMISEMIGIMGAPEEYQEAANENKRKTPVKTLYNPNALKSKVGKGLNAFWQATGRFFYLIYRTVMIAVGSALSLLGFICLFSFIAVLFFNGTPLVKELFEPAIVNINTLLSIVLNTYHVVPIIILTAIVVIIPLSMITYLGIVMVFNLKENSKAASIIIFSVWLISVAILGVILSAKLSVYSNSKSSSTRIEIKSSPDTIYLAPMKNISELQGFDKAGVDCISFFHSKKPEVICMTADVNISASDSAGSFIEIRKKARGKSDFEAHSNLRNIDYSYKYSGDTLYFDEYFRLKPDTYWNGSSVTVWVAGRKNTIVKCLPGINPEIFHAHYFNHTPPILKINEYGFEDIEN